MATVDRLASQAAWLAESLAEHAAYWNSLGALTPAQKRWKAHELAWRKNLAAAAQTRAEAMPATWLIASIRSGEKERRDQRSMQNLLRDRARLAQWRREGYSFDSEHRLVAPQRPTGGRPRHEGRESRPSRRRSGTRASPSGDEGEPPPSQRARVCGYCGRGLEGERPNKHHCTDSHRVMASRARKRERKRPIGLTPESLEASFAELNGYAARLPDNFAAVVLTDFEAGGYVQRLPDGSFGPTERARAQLRGFWAAGA
jgi:hypothetical protein